MHNKKPCKPLSLILGGLLAGAATQAPAAGFAIIEQSASGMGNAFAGAAAVAEDASTIYFNPAGITYLPGSQMVVAGHVIVPKADFSNRGSYVNPQLTGGVPLAGSLSGPDDEGGETKFVPNFYYSTEVGDGWFAGVGINAPFGLATKYDRDWVGRYHAIESEIVTLNINPTLAWRINDRIAVGAGLSAQYIDATLSNVVDMGSVCFGLEGRGYIPAGSCAGAGVMPLAADGYAKVTGTDWSFGFNLGLMVDLSDHTRLGVAYRSRIKQDLEGHVKYEVPANFQAILDQGIPLFTNAGAQASVDLPETVNLGLYHAFNDQWAVLAGAIWTRWSRFDELRISYDNPNQPTTVQPENWDDAWRYSLGVIYRPDATWTFRLGVAYDETPIPKAEDRTPRIPGNDRTWVAFGLGYQISSRLALDVGYAHLFIDTTKVDTLDHNTFHQLVGEYDSQVDIFSAQLKMTF